MVSKTNLTLDLRMGNNNGAATPVVYDSSATGADATCQDATTSTEGKDGYVELDMSTNYMVGTGTGIFNSANISIIWKFAPSFNYDNNATRYFFYTEAGKRYYAYKASNASFNSIGFYLGDTFIGSTKDTEYSDYWTVDKPMIFIISGTSGDTSMWINGNKIVDGDSSAWTSKDPSAYTLGAIDTGSGKVGGKLYYFKVLKRILTDDEVAALSADRSLNMTPLSKQLLSDGDMEAADTSAWTSFNNATLTKETTTPHSGSRCLRIEYTDTNTPRARQIVITTGNKYRVTGWARGDGSSSPYVTNSGIILWTGTTSTDWQYFDELFTAAATTFYIGVSSGGTSYVEFDDVTIMDVTNVINMTPLSKQLLSDGDMEAADTSAYTAYGGGILTKETGTPHSGTRVLRVAGTTGGYAGQNVLSSGGKYRVTGWARGDGTSNPAIGNWVNFWTGTSSSSWQYFDEEFDFNTNGIFYLRKVGATYVEFDDVKVSDITNLVNMA